MNREACKAGYCAVENHACTFTWGLGYNSFRDDRRQPTLKCVCARRAWTEAQVAAAARATVVVLYASAYGNTAALAQALSRGITKAGMCYLLCLKTTAGSWSVAADAFKSCRILHTLLAMVLYASSCQTAS